VRRAVATGLAAILLAVLTVGVALLPTLHPALTANLVQRYSSSADAGLSGARMLELAEEVRGFVADGHPDTLPSQVDGRLGFDRSAVSHLRDVRGVLLAARAVTAALALVALVWMVVALSRKRLAELSSALLWACGLTLGFMAFAGAAATMDFEGTFSFFHRLFFSAGTWSFPQGTLLIQLFPAEFWSAMGAIWGGIAVVLGLALGVTGWFLRSAPRTET
jgi:integral membrane protein (TIGR01906 family)